MNFAIIPRPLRVEPREGRFDVSRATSVNWEGAWEPAAQPAHELGRWLYVDTGLKPDVAPVDGADAAAGSILLARAEAAADLGPEGYELVVSPQSVLLSALDRRGLLHGVQTLRQILPVRSPRSRRGLDRGSYPIGCLRIVDRPRHSWRGLLVDCARHFVSVGGLKRYLDLLAYHKMNVLHWHLTDDQGWRIEINRFPRLTDAGAWRGRGPSKHGGFYTQQEVRQVIAHAESLGITVVPEIDMPGHALAALAAYPELSCTGGPFEVPSTWGIFEDVFCVGKEETFAFLEGVLEEVLEVFPSAYVHVGGDEVETGRWSECPRCQERMRKCGLTSVGELQGYFTQRIAKYLLDKGRIPIGWDEILEAGAPQQMVVQWWREADQARAALRRGHRLIASPRAHCYLDLDLQRLDLRRAYAFDPLPEGACAAETGAVLGGQCNMWTERASEPRIDSRVFPRLCAHAEALWLPASEKNWSDFVDRLSIHVVRLSAMGIDVGPGLPDSVRLTTPPECVGRWEPAQMSEELVHLEWDVTRLITQPGAYEVEVRYESGAQVWPSITCRSRAGPT